MDAIKFLLFFVLLSGFHELTFAQTKDCSGTCTLQFRCDPYYKNLSWAVSGSVCRVFQNLCIFQSNNCHRQNQCLRTLVSTPREKCMEYCPSLCPSGGLQVCASFSYVDIRGVKRDRQVTFPNRCLLDQYACQNDNAYIGEPSIGPCP